MSHSSVIFALFCASKKGDWSRKCRGHQTMTASEELDKFKCLEAKCRGKNPGKVQARTYGTKSPSRSEALRFIDSAKSPSTKIDGSLVNFRRMLSNRHVLLCRIQADPSHSIIPLSQRSGQAPSGLWTRLVRIT